MDIGDISDGRSCVEEVEADIGTGGRQRIVLAEDNLQSKFSQIRGKCKLMHLRTIELQY